MAKIKMLFPVAKVHITSGFWRNGKPHGQDFGAKVGDKVYAVDSGVVTKSSYDDISGNIVIIYHTKTKIYTEYAHLYQKFVSKGQSIKRGKVIGSCGYSGHTIPEGVNGTHLHFGIAKRASANGYLVKATYINPVNFDWVTISAWKRAIAKITPKKAK